MQVLQCRVWILFATATYKVVPGLVLQVMSHVSAAQSAPLVFLCIHRENYDFLKPLAPHLQGKVIWRQSQICQCDLVSCWPCNSTHRSIPSAPIHWWVGRCWWTSATTWRRTRTQKPTQSTCNGKMEPPNATLVAAALIMWLESPDSGLLSKQRLVCLCVCVASGWSLEPMWWKLLTPCLPGPCRTDLQTPAGR